MPVITRAENSKFKEEIEQAEKRGITEGLGKQKNKLIHLLTEWSLTRFSIVFQLYCSGQCTYTCFPGVLLTCAPHNNPLKPLAAFPHNLGWCYQSPKLPLAIKNCSWRLKTPKEQILTKKKKKL